MLRKQKFWNKFCKKLGLGIVISKMQNCKMTFILLLRPKISEYELDITCEKSSAQYLVHYHKNSYKESLNNIKEKRQLRASFLGRSPSIDSIESR